MIFMCFIWGCADNGCFFWWGSAFLFFCNWSASHEYMIFVARLVFCSVLNVALEDLDHRRSGLGWMVGGWQGERYCHHQHSSALIWTVVWTVLRFCQMQEGEVKRQLLWSPCFLRGEWADANKELIASFSLSAVLTKWCFCALCRVRNVYMHPESGHACISCVHKYT